MATSGTFAFSPSTGEIILQAFRRIGTVRANVSAEMMLDARMELNLMASAWANTGPSLWAIDLQTVALVPGVPTISIDPATIDILDAWVTVGTQDLVIAPINRGTYASYVNKLQLGRPTTFWFDRLISPTVTFWPVPDGAASYVFNFFRARQTQDEIAGAGLASASGGLTPDAPFRFLDALCWGLSERLAYIYAPDRLATVGAKAQRALAEAQAEDTEDGPIQFTPNISGYFW